LSTVIVVKSREEPFLKKIERPDQSEKTQEKLIRVKILRTLKFAWHNITAWILKEKQAVEWVFRDKY
jgi:hypothetical protein